MGALNCEDSSLAMSKVQEQSSPPDESDTGLDRLGPAPLATSSGTSQRWVALQAVLDTALLIAWELAVMNIYLRLHGIKPWVILSQGEPLSALRFVTSDKTLGLGVEIFAWAGTAVVVRRLVKVARDAKGGHANLRQDLMDFIADYAESIFLTFLLMALLRVPKITLGTGIDLSLNEASVDVVIALASLLGWSVRETRILLSRLFRVVFSGHGMQGSGANVT
jgi:hypothetical protein